MSSRSIVDSEIHSLLQMAEYWQQGIIVMEKLSTKGTKSFMSLNQTKI